MNKFATVLIFLISVYQISCGDRVDQNEVSVKKFDSLEDKTDLTEKEEPVVSEDSESNGSSVKVISSKEVKGHIGDSLTIRGYVADVYVTEKVSYLNFEFKFPKNIFSCAIFSSNAGAFGDLSKYKGKIVEVTGKITTYKSKPQVILSSPDRIKIIK